MEQENEVQQQESKLQGIRDGITAIRGMQHSTERENAFRALHLQIDRVEREIQHPHPAHHQVASSPDPDLITLVGGKFLKGGEPYTGDIELMDPEEDTLLFGVTFGIMTDGPRMKPDAEKKDTGVSEVIELKRAAAPSPSELKALDEAKARLATPAAPTAPPPVDHAAVGKGTEVKTAPPLFASGYVGHATSADPVPPVKIPDGIHTGNSIDQPAGIAGEKGKA